MENFTSVIESLIDSTRTSKDKADKARAEYRKGLKVLHGLAEAPGLMPTLLSEQVFAEFPKQGRKSKA